MAISETKKKGGSVLTNPIVSRVGKLQDPAMIGIERATYGGIGLKGLFFLLFTVVGAIVYFAVFEPIFMSMSINSAIWLIALLAIDVLTGILACFNKSLCAVWGTIYSFVEGILIPFIIKSYVTSDGKNGWDYSSLALWAAIITVSIVLVMLALYMSGVVSYTKRVKTVILTLFITSVVVSLVFFLLTLFARNSAFVQYLLGNKYILIAGSLIGIILASLFLVSDFDTIEKTVKQGLPKKYEWVAAFGLVFTVLWLYLKVVSLLANSRRN